MHGILYDYELTDERRCDLLSATFERGWLTVKQTRQTASSRSCVIVMQLTYDQLFMNNKSTSICSHALNALLTKKYILRKMLSFRSLVCYSQTLKA